MKKTPKALTEVWKAQEKLFEKAKSLGCASDITEYVKFVREKAASAQKNPDILLTDEDTRVPVRSFSYSLTEPLPPPTPPSPPPPLTSWWLLAYTLG
jgi:hypothetical protein